MEIKQSNRHWQHLPPPPLYLIPTQLNLSPQTPPSPLTRASWSGRRSLTCGERTPGRVTVPGPVLTPGPGHHDAGDWCNFETQANLSPRLQAPGRGEHDHDTPCSTVTPA
eukprot:929433-Rhodomonas_salina.2